MKSLIKSVTRDKKVVLVGYGREGKSSLGFIRETCPDLKLWVADADPEITAMNPELNQDGIEVLCGASYLNNLNRFDLILKSPGVSFKDVDRSIDPGKISSQTDLFLKAYAGQIAGITGTKGKSTTASLTYQIIRSYTTNTLLAGNIGVPLFNLIPQINPETRIVCEFSSHQLQYISTSPHISVLLNIYQEHLDHYPSFYAYQLAKMQIGVHQSAGDYFLWNAADENIHQMMLRQPVPAQSLPVYNSVFRGNGIGLSGNNVVIRIGSGERIVLPAEPETKLQGAHNRINISMAAAAASLMNIPAESIARGVSDFRPLEHRIQYEGTFHNRKFYNDSISTIPEATIAAVNTLGKVETLILGGFDRGIDYTPLIEFLKGKPEISLIFTGPAGKRMMAELSSQEPGNRRSFFFAGFIDAVNASVEKTPEGGTCLLSPAASSYDSFKNFEERGRCFRELISQ